MWKKFELGTIDNGIANVNDLFYMYTENFMVSNIFKLQIKKYGRYDQWLQKSARYSFIVSGELIGGC